MVSYSCMENMKSIINKHNKKVLSNNNNQDNESLFNCRSKQQCPLNNNCLSSSIIYNTQITTTDNKTTPKNNIGLTEGTFKQRFNQHKVTFRHRKYTNNKVNTPISIVIFAFSHLLYYKNLL